MYGNMSLECVHSINHCSDSRNINPRPGLRLGQARFTHARMIQLSCGYQVSHGTRTHFRNRHSYGTQTHFEYLSPYGTRNHFRVYVSMGLEPTYETTSSMGSNHLWGANHGTYIPTPLCISISVGMSYNQGKLRIRDYVLIYSWLLSSITRWSLSPILMAS